MPKQNVRLTKGAGLLDGAGTCWHELSFCHTQVLYHASEDKTCDASSQQVMNSLVLFTGCHCDVTRCLGYPCVNCTLASVQLGVSTS